MKILQRLAASLALALGGWMVALALLVPVRAEPPLPARTLNALPIAYGQTVTGAIVTPGQVFSYTFNAAGGDVILLAASDDDSNFDPQLDLFGPGNTLLASRFDGGNYVELTHTLTAAGLYTLTIADNGNTDT
ncbi:MAG: hypothetical protein D6796_08400, partial [Caldilineae bacterium]